MFHLEFYVENHPFHSPLLTPGGHTTMWYFKYGKACLQLAERILESMPKSDSYSAVWQNVIKLYSCPLIRVEIKFLFEFLDKFIIPSLTSNNELGFSSGYLEHLWPAIVLKHNETLSKMLMSQSKYFPSTEEWVKLSLKDPAAIKHFNLEVQRPMLQEALKVIKDHGTEWLSFPKLFGMGADQEFQSSFWSSVQRVLDIPLERKPGNMPITNEYVYGQSIYTPVSKDKAGLVKWANVWNLQQPQLLNEIKAVATSHESFLINKESNPHLFEFYAKHIFSLPLNNVIAEQQFNLSQLYLHDNLSELSKQASIMFVENILCKGRT
ncbi:uncharacterized protein LOC122959024 [Acropora millepora]|uniref:uncharacterized protein LOC122959024 n=1 Tax=Acropora millepora TaxID=45264 RepID=UPI001CF42C94|nr:uncharacterized protein LOC122959024 [Acropora millepora]